MLVRYEHNGKVRYGWMVDDKVRMVVGDVFYAEGGRPYIPGKELPVSEVRLLAPCEPSKVVCIGVNYVDHAKEMGRELPREPLMFLKPSTAVIGPNEPIVYPRLSQNVHHEAELAVVIKKRARHVKAAEAKEYILGYTCAVDVTARDLQFADGQWTRGKSFDTFCPLGPGIVPAAQLDPSNLAIRLTVNGEVRQEGNTAQMVFNVYQLIEAVTAVMTLLPGDVILTGTPPGVGPIKPGDVVSVTIDGIGTLTNPVVAEGEKTASA